MKQTVIALDQLANTIVWIPGDGFGYADETLSARAWRLRHSSNAYRIIDTIFFWQEYHCKEAYQSEVERKHLPRHYGQI